MSRKSSKRKHPRRRARESALSVLYSGDIMEAQAIDLVMEGAYPAGELNMSEYAESLIEGVCAHREEIDARIEATSENWTMERMPVVDRAILRLAVYEMIYVDDVPVSVAINEAVELAKSYGGEDESSRFVNGVLGRISRAIDAEDAEGAEPGSQGDGGLSLAPDSAQEHAAISDAQLDSPASQPPLEDGKHE